MNQGYLSDEELKRLIEDVEDNKMLQAPANLKQQVLETLDADKARIRTKKQRKKLVIFEMKIAGGLAAAMLMLFLCRLRHRASRPERLRRKSRPSLK